VVIIAIVDGDRILLTRYSRGCYRRHSLVAGFVEIGETLEDAVRREVMEEVGLHVKDIRYCESQPWPFSSSLIAGFFADVDGDPTVHLNTDGQDELAEGVWVSRDELVMEDSGLSLTWDMIRKFRDRTFL
jgi:NAD+ diphosphatase